MGILIPNECGIFEKQLLWVLLHQEPSKVKEEMEKMQEEMQMSLDWNNWINQFNLIQRILRGKEK